MERGGRIKGKKKNKWKGKDFTGTSRMVCSERTYTSVRIGVLFTLGGIHSSPVKRVKTQKSESLFVTSFDMAINSFEITAGYAGRIFDNRRRCVLKNSNFRQIAGCSSRFNIRPRVSGVFVLNIEPGPRVAYFRINCTSRGHAYGRRAEEKSCRIVSARETRNLKELKRTSRAKRERRRGGRKRRGTARRNL